MNRRFVFVCLILLLMLTSCNLPLAHSPTSQQPSQPTSANPPARLPTLGGPGVQIISPADGSQVAAGVPVQVQFAGAGGPFIEADLADETGIVSTLTLDASNPSPSGAFAWTPASGGQHTLTISVLTADKQSYSASVTVKIAGAAAAATAAPLGGATPVGTVDPSRAAVLAQVLQIFRDTYGLKISDPPLARKYRSGVPNDPWVSVVYVNHWMYALSVFPDRVEQDVHPVNMQDDGSVPLPPKVTATPVCRPAGTLKLLVAFVDYQNLNVTKDQAFAALQKATQSINTQFSQYSTAGGASSPILQIQTTPVFISPPPAMPDDFLTPAIVKSVTGVDPAAYDLLVQIDLDANNTRRQLNASHGYDTNGLEFSACLGNGLSIWMTLNTLDQALDQDSENTMERLISHELLHTFGYPGDHRWPAGDGSQVDMADQSDIFNWPTLILGWTDTDGDGIPEIIDPTPYGP